MNKRSGFTIVELLVVIVVIGILAAITIVSYTGISQKAVVASLQSDLSNSSKVLKMYYTEYGSYPTNDLTVGNHCTTDSKYCLRTSSNNTISYYSGDNKSFYLISSNGNVCYRITDQSSPVEDCITIGSQVWIGHNLNIGDMINSSSNQTSGNGIEKYCYDNLESNCSTYGGLYQWDEAMQYVTTSGAQGICPSGSHIPSDNDLKILEVQLGMTQGQADSGGWRGTDQGSKLKTGGISGLNIPLAGYRNNSGSFSNLSSYGGLWSSSESGTNAWYRLLSSSNTTSYRAMDFKVDGWSVRCLKN